MKNKDTAVKLRLAGLGIAALILAVAMVWTGCLGFLTGETAPMEETRPVQQLSGQVTGATEPTASTEVTETTEPTASTEITEPAEPLREPVAVPAPTPEPKSHTAAKIGFFICLMAEIMVVTLLLVLSANVRNHKNRKAAAYRPTRVSAIPLTWKRLRQPTSPAPGISLGKAHDIGRRDYQQDSFGHQPILDNTGVLAVLADGMGGLSGGERVSQKIVVESLNFAAAIRQEQLPNALPEMVEQVNQAVNAMLGPEGLYASGSTLVAALIAGGTLRWISVGDSRVYLYREGQIDQLSQDHDLLQDWMPDILAGRRTMAEAEADPDGRKLTSFIGMGQLRHVDYNRAPIPLLPGDRVLLMSDGIYGTVSDRGLAAILAGSKNVQDAADQVAQAIREADLPYQDNYTLVILGWD